jgi:hypothetical protein
MCHVHDIDRLPRLAFLGNLPRSVGFDSKLGVGAAAIIVFAALLACKSGSKAKCESAVQMSAVRHSSIGTDSDPAQARDNSVVGACIAYCQWGDPTVRAAYDKWKLDNPSSPATPETIVTIHVKRDVDACKPRCALAIKNGSATVKTECL